MLPNLGKASSPTIHPWEASWTIPSPHPPCVCVREHMLPREAICIQNESIRLQLGRVATQAAEEKLSEEKSRHFMASSQATVAIARRCAGE
jgi:hypothetical protein